MPVKIWLLLSCSMVTCALSAQRMVFSMNTFGINFGKMTVERKQLNDSTEEYTLHASGYLKVLWMERRDETHYQTRFVHGRLVYSQYKHIESGVVKKWNTIKESGNGCQVKSHKGDFFLKEKPDASVLQMYFEKPQKLASVFHEAEVGLIPLNYKNDGTIEFKVSDGSRTQYQYTENKLTGMVVHLPIATVTMKRIE